MADGLRVLGCCPRCRGELEFASISPCAASPREEPPADATLAPHLVLGRPRRRTDDCAM